MNDSASQRREHVADEPMPSEDTQHDSQKSDEGAASSVAAAAREAAIAGDHDDAVDLSAQLDEQKDRVMRLQAEMQNLRQRTSREIADERRYGALPIMRDFLPVVDNIDRAIEAAEKDSNAESLLEGFRMMRQQLLSILERHQCEPIEAAGATFDPGIHEAILQQPSSEHPAGTVSLVTQMGYRLHDRVVRPTQVIVSSGPPVEETNN